MNLVLLGGADATHFPAGTPQAEHLLRVLKIAVGETFWCGVKNGVRGLATVLAISPDGAISFSVEWEKGVVFSPPPVRILVGLSRPQTMKKIFAAASEIGCSRIDVFRSGKGDPAYAESSLWKPGDSTLADILKKSAEQTCVPVLPEFRFFASLKDFIESENALAGTLRLALDVYANQKSLAETAFPPDAEALLAIGSERGWSDDERAQLRAGGFTFAHLGERVLRVETAVSVALAVALSKTNAWQRAHRAILR
ncbi:MAG: 16S rRNA (uracil(1498)-N(3))-methyltransferase [Verrucomicrobia bacterium]|nr:16S rRNA (uracil(1498)-N(3))-methyltransferase [Verrucomicrobiota bacterium]